MEIPSIELLIPILQTAIGPMILISGIGLLLLTMTNRLGRVIDRARILAGNLIGITAEKKEKTLDQLQILWRRARLIRLSITLAAASALSAAILIIVLFFTALWQIETAWIIVVLFIACMLCFIGSLILFIRDINQSLEALGLEFTSEGDI
jgi:Na+/melibiose symporter-like transporter